MKVSSCASCPNCRWYLRLILRISFPFCCWVKSLRLAVAAASLRKLSIILPALRPAEAPKLLVIPFTTEAFCDSICDKTDPNGPPCWATASGPPPRVYFSTMVARLDLGAMARATARSMALEIPSIWRRRASCLRRSFLLPIYDKMASLAASYAVALVSPLNTGRWARLSGA